MACHESATPAGGTLSCLAEREGFERVEASKLRRKKLAA